MPKQLFRLKAKIIYRLYCSYIRRLTPPHLHIIAWAFPQCKNSRPTTKATDSRQPALSGTVQGQVSVY